MSALADTEARIASIGKLKAVIGAMRGIAATHSQQARDSLAGYRAYAEVIAGGLGEALALLDPETRADETGTDGPLAVVVYGAEHGFAGAFSERLLDQVPKTATAIYLLGSRAVALAERRGLPVAWTSEMASQASGVGEVARRVADALYAGFTRGDFRRADVLFARPSGATQVEACRRTVLPIDLARFSSRRAGPPPVTNLPPARLVERLIGEHVFAELALGALESFASENAARLATMESARLNIEQKLDELSGQERLLRQEQITAEVQDVVSGALAAEAAWDRRGPAP